MASTDNKTERLIQAHGGYAGFSVAPLGNKRERVLHIKCMDNTEIPVQNLPASTLNRLCCEDAEFERFLNGITAPSVHYQAIATELQQVSRAMVHTLRAHNEVLSQENQELCVESLHLLRPELANIDAEREMRQLEAENTQLGYSLRETQMELGLLRAQREADTARIRASLASLIDAKRLVECVLPANDALLRHIDPVVQTHMTTTNEAYWRMSELLGRIIDEVEEDESLPEPTMTPARGAADHPEYLVPQDILPDAIHVENAFDLEQMLLGNPFSPRHLGFHGSAAHST